MLRTLALITTAIVFSCSAFAQSATGILQGRVTDPSGASIPEANVTIENQRTGVRQTLQTNAEGSFVQTYLIPSEYRVTAEKTGFQKFQNTDVRVAVQQTVDLAIVLKVGDVGTTVEVSANAVQLSTSTSSVSTVISTKQILELPTSGRGVYGLTALTPGVTGGGGLGGSFSGGRGGTNEIMIDGTSITVPENNVSTNDTGYQPILDSVEEISVIANAMNAEYGRTGGGAINVATKSGTNAFHGSLFEFLRNDKLDANSWTNNRNGQTKNPLRRNQFGGTIGGPISIPGLYSGKNKTFFFVAEQSTIQRQAASGTATVPTAEFRAGNFANLRNSAGAPVTIYDPATATCTANCDSANPTFTRQPFPNNQIPMNRFDPVAVKMLTYLPLPNNPGGVLNQFTQQNNYRNQGSAKQDGHKFDARVDHNFTEKFRIWVRGSYENAPQTPFNLYNNLGTTGDGPNKSINYNIALNGVYTINPTTILNFNYGLPRKVYHRDPFSQGLDLTTLGFPAAVNLQAATQNQEFPRINIGGNQQGYTIGQSTFTAIRIQSYDHEFRGDLTKVLRGHTIKGGAQTRRMFMNFRQNGAPSGQYNFNNTLWTQQTANTNTTSTTQGMGFANFLLGLPNASLQGAQGSGGNTEHTVAAAQASSYWGFYLQDDWKVKRNLTLNIGLRWDVDIPRTERYDRLSYFDLDAASPIAGQVPALGERNATLKGAMKFVGPNGDFGRRQAPTDLNNWGPRFGFAYQIGEKMVFRGAYGIVYGASVQQASGTSGSSGMSGFTGNTPINSSFDGVNVQATLSNPFPAGFNLPLGSTETPLSGSATSLGFGVGGNGELFTDYQNPIIQQWNANIQRELPGGLLVEVGYIGSKGQHILDNETGMVYNQLPGSFMSLGSQLTAQVANPFYGVITNPNSALSRPQVSYNQLLRPYPHYDGVNAFRKPGGNSLYHAMTIRVEKRYSHGLSLLAAFTGGKSIDDTSSQPQGNNNSGTKQDAYNRAADRSLSAFDIPRRLVISGNYELPFGKGRPFGTNMHRAVDALLGGWQINGIYTLQRGTPLTFSTGTPNTTGIFSPGQRLNNNGQSAKLDTPVEERLTRAFDTSVFSLPAPFTFGNLGRVSPDLRGAHTNGFDASLFKDFRITEGVRARFQGEAYNAGNHPIWGNPGTNFNEPGNFGVIQNKNNNNRTMQLALRLNF